MKMILFLQFLYTVDGFIFVGTNFRGLNKNDTFVGFEIRGFSIFLHNSYRKLLISVTYISELLLTKFSFLINLLFYIYVIIFNILN